MDRLQQALLIAPAVVDLAIDEIIFQYGHLEDRRDESVAASK